MDELIKLKNKINKRKDKKRKNILYNLLEKLDNLEIDNRPVSENLQNSSRPKYKSPLERSTQNYGYEEISEIGSGTDNIW